MSYETGINVFDYDLSTRTVIGSRFTLLTNQDLRQHYQNMGYSLQEEHPFANAALQVYTMGDGSRVAVIIPWSTSDKPAQLTEIHFRQLHAKQFMADICTFLSKP